MKMNKRKIITFIIVLFALVLLVSSTLFLRNNIDVTSFTSTESSSYGQEPDFSYDKTDVTSFANTNQVPPEDWRLILVNNAHSIPKNYQIELCKLSNGIYIDSRIYPDLQQMFDDARSEGIYPIVGEGYRTHEEQKKMMDDKIDCFMKEGYSKKEAKELAKKWVAIPGTSEHELGIALDINADESLSSNDAVYNWLAENAYQYGFILRYPQNKEYITGIDYEPWHYRYVGKESAREIYTQQITLEEYLEATSKNLFD